MNKLFFILIAVAGVFIGSYTLAQAASKFLVQQGGTGTTTAPLGQLIYGGSDATNIDGRAYRSVATTSVSCTGSISCTSFTAIGAAAVTITGSAASSPIATSTNETAGQLAYWTSTSATPATLGKVATTTLAFSGPFNGASALGTLVGGTNSTITWTGLSTTTALTQGQLLYSTGAAGVSSVATTSLTLTSFPANFSGTLGALVGGTNSSWTYWGLSTSTEMANTQVPYGTAVNTLGSEAGFTYTASTDNLAFLFGSTTSLTSSGGSWFAATSGRVGIGTTTPFGKLSVNAIAGDGGIPSLVVGSSSATHFVVGQNGNIITTAIQPATTTAITLDWSNTPPQVEYRIGTSATTITLINATTSRHWGTRKLVWVCNPAGTAGALTWVGVEWIGTAPTQTTTASYCDVYSFDVTMATSSSAFKVGGSAGTGFQ